MGNEHQLQPKRHYTYVGPADILQRIDPESERFFIKAKADVVSWCTANTSKQREAIPATFIIDVKENLLIADRRSEHVACARGNDVLSAGEMFILLRGGDVEIVEVSNQSTGYCPEPESWDVVKLVLDRLQIKHPQQFTASFTFRRCDSCSSTNIVKEGIFECAVCGSPLSEEWNF